MPRKAATGKPAETAHFGDRVVTAEEKTSLVGSVFTSVAGRYDLMNDLMSGGLHRLWKRAFVAGLRPRGAERIVDLAGGTGDIAFKIAPRLDDAGLVTVIDINPAMIAAGRARAATRPGAGRIRWIVGDAERLPLASRSVDAVTIAFGIRNVTRIDHALGEIARVLRPGGRFHCLEMSRDVLPGLARLYDLYSFRVIPRIGAWVTGDAPSYRYFVESIRRFPAPGEFSAMIARAGLERVRQRPLAGGIVRIHSAWKV